MIVPKFKILLHTVYSSSAENKSIDDLYDELKAFYDHLTNHNCNSFNHEHADRSTFLFNFEALCNIDINDQTKRNDLYNQLDNLLNQDRNSLANSIQSATKDNKVLHILKGVLDEVGFDWSKYTKPQKNLPQPPQNQVVDNSSKKPAEKTESKLKQFFLPVAGAVSIIGTLIFLVWNKLFGTQPILPDPTNNLKDTKPPINLKQILQNLPKT